MESAYLAMEPLRQLEGTVVVSGVSPIGTEGTLHLRGQANYQIPRTLTVASGKRLNLEIAAGSTSAVAAGTPFNTGLGVSLIVNGRLTNSQTLLLGGGSLQGIGITENVTNSLGVVSPGNSVGILTVRDYSQSSGGTLSIELAGGFENVSDQLALVTQPSVAL